MIKLENLHKTYQGDTGSLEALRGVSAHVREGEIYGVIGKSGAGKSTLIRCINMLERPTSGSVVVDDEEPWVTWPSGSGTSVSEWMS